MPQPVYTYTTTVGNILSSVSTDIRQQLSATTDSSILIDFTDRVSKEILRKTRWTFLLSDFKQFVTDTGVNNYWLGANGSIPSNSYAVDTHLNLTDLRKIKGDSVRDRSNFKRLMEAPNAPLATTTQYPDNSSRLGRPVQWQQNQTNPGVFTLWPAPDNQNNYSPVPEAPILRTLPFGSLPARTYVVCVTWVDGRGNESTPSAPSKIFLPVNTILNVQNPQPPLTSATGVAYSNYSVYAREDDSLGAFNPSVNNLLLQASTLAIGSAWDENAATGLILSGPTPPTSSSVEPIDGYIIEFQYYKLRIALTSSAQTLQVPDDYKDVMVSGVTAYALRYLGRTQDAAMSYSKFQSGVTQIVGDINWNSDAPDFISPDGASIQYPNPAIDTDEFGFAQF